MQEPTPPSCCSFTCKAASVVELVRLWVLATCSLAEAGLSLLPVWSVSSVAAAAARAMLLPPLLLLL